MDQDKIEEGMLMAQEGMLLNRINIKALLQLLVERRSSYKGRSGS